MYHTADHSVSTRAGLFEAGLRYPRVSAKFELKYESSKSKFSLILFAYNLMIGYSKKNKENLSEKVLLIARKRNPG